MCCGRKDGISPDGCGPVGGFCFQNSTQCVEQLCESGRSSSAEINRFVSAWILLAMLTVTGIVYAEFN